jgi:hypothetical protein
MEFFYAINMSSSHQKANQDSWYSEMPQCTCSQCNTEAEFGYFTVPGSAMNATSGLPDFVLFNDESPKIVNFPEGHRCPGWPCPTCHPGRCQREGTSRMLGNILKLFQSPVFQTVDTDAGDFLVQFVKGRVPLFK